VKDRSILKSVIIGVVLFSGVLWALSSAAQKRSAYPNANFMANAQWLKAHLNDTDLVVADVRTDEYFGGGVIPGAVRLVWSDFRHNDVGRSVASTFVGVKQAQDVLGRSGITRHDTVILYDSVERDGGATASYVFWVLDVLGHEKKKILERGIDGWKDAGYDLVTKPRQPQALLYQSGMGNIQRNKLIDGDFVYKRLGDPFYQIVDVRSAAEYRGEKGTKGLDGKPLKLGHIPTAVNINYQAAWTDPETKHIKPYAELQTLYRGLDSAKGVIVYCNSGRRSAFSFFVLRLMGFENVVTYESSWKQWGNPDNFFPVETRENRLAGTFLPEPSKAPASAVRTTEEGKNRKPASSSPSGGYVSCGG
jgi:thiosulfate/3-mercaptopyruvate sulfurtransferase